MPMAVAGSGVPGGGVGDHVKEIQRRRGGRPAPGEQDRVEAGDEVDLVLERDDDQVIAFKIKAGSRISGEDLRGLRQLKERLGTRRAGALAPGSG
jgi:hypothetical protein